MGLVSKWLDKNPNMQPPEGPVKLTDGSVSPKWQTGVEYDIIGQNHVEHVQAKMKQLGYDKDYEIVIPADNQLFIDYDSKTLPDQFETALQLLAQAYCRVGESVLYTVTRSMSGNLHACVSVPTKAFTPLERVAWQAVFGSDLKREGLSLMSIARQLKNPTLLIELKGGSPIVTQGSLVLPPKPEPVGRKFR